MTRARGWAVLAMTLFVVAMACLTIFGNVMGSLLAYSGTYALLWLALGGIVRGDVFKKRAGVRGPTAAMMILLVAASARIALVLTTTPMLSDDLWRYIFDGQTLGVLGHNPYVLSPADAGSELPINHPALVTIYQPTSQWIFAGLAKLGGAPSVTFRLGFVVVDLMLIVLLMGALYQRGRSLGWAALYAWHPLALSETAGSGHQDVLGIFWLVAALIAVSTAGVGAAALTGGCLALAVGVKPIVLPLLLPMVWSMRSQWRRVLAFLSAFGVGLVLLYFPFAMMEGGLTGMIDTGRTFVDTWAFNASIYPAIFYITASKSIAQVCCGVVLIGVLGGITFGCKDLWRAALIYLTSALLLSSTVHPWYLLWVLALLPLAFSVSVWVWSVTIMLAYTAWLNTQTFQPWVVAVVAEYVPVYLLLGVGVWRGCPRWSGQGTGTSTLG